MVLGGHAGPRAARQRCDSLRDRPSSRFGRVAGSPLGALEGPFGAGRHLRSDILPYDANDERLQNGFEEVDNTEAELAGLEAMGHGRKRVLSQYGLDLAADRWYDSAQGSVPGVKPDAMCATCGFLLKMTGSMGTLFGVCANEWSPDDGRVVSFDHSCGAHSETDQPRQGPQWPIVPSRLDDDAVEFEEF